MGGASCAVHRGLHLGPPGPRGGSSASSGVCRLTTGLPLGGPHGPVVLERGLRLDPGPHSVLRIRWVGPEWPCGNAAGRQRAGGPRHAGATAHAREPVRSGPHGSEVLRTGYGSTGRAPVALRVGPDCGDHDDGLPIAPIEVRLTQGERPAAVLPRDHRPLDDRVIGITSPLRNMKWHEHVECLQCCTPFPRYVPGNGVRCWTPFLLLPGWAVVSVGRPDRGSSAATPTPATGRRRPGSCRTG